MSLRSFPRGLLGPGLALNVSVSIPVCVSPDDKLRGKCHSDQRVSAPPRGPWLQAKPRDTGALRQVHLLHAVKGFGSAPV